MKDNCNNMIYADGFVSGELDDTSMRKFEQHLSACDECRNEVEFLRGFKGALDASYSYHLDETFNYKVVNNLRREKRAEERKEIRIAVEDIFITLATLLVIVILGIQLFNRPTVSAFEMSGKLTKVEKSSVEEATISNDQLLEIVFQQTVDEHPAQGSK